MGLSYHLYPNKPPDKWLGGCCGEEHNFAVAAGTKKKHYW
jgi:hypothetical protein